MDFDVRFDTVVNGFGNGDVNINHTGTSNSGISISPVSGSRYTVTVSGIAGDGSFTMSVNTGSGVQDAAGNNLDSSVTSSAVEIDNTPPTVVTQTHTEFLSAAGFAGITWVDINNGSFDSGSGIASYQTSPSAFNCSHIGPNTVTLTITDRAGNQASNTAVRHHCR